MYSIRTGILPLMFIFNTDLLLMGISSWWPLALTIVTAITAMLVFAAATQGWLLRRSSWYESLILLLITFTLLRPGFWLDLVSDPYRAVPASRMVELAGAAPEDARLRVRVEGLSIEGKAIHETVLPPLGDAGDGLQRIQRAGITLANGPAQVDILAVRLKRQAHKAGLEPGFTVAAIELPADRPAKQWLYLPASLLLAAVLGLQRLRRDEGLPRRVAAEAGGF